MPININVQKVSGTNATTGNLVVPTGKSITATGSGVIAATSAPASGITGVVDVPHGGTGASSLTGYVKGNGTATMTASASVPVSDLSGTLPITNGGTGATTASGARTALGLGTAATLNAAVANGAATLDGTGKLAASQVPDISVVQYLGVVASQSAMLALTGQQGDWCTRSDLGTNWIITGNDPSQLSSWTQLSYPTAPVTSVFGRSGAVTAVSTDYSASGITNTAIGASNPSTGAFTTLSASNTISVSGSGNNYLSAFSNLSTGYAGLNLATDDASSIRRYGPSATGTNFGYARASSTVLTENAGYLLIGTNALTPVVIGTNNTAALTIGTSQQIILANALGLAYGGTGATTQAGAANAVLPAQTSQSGKYLTTDGTNVSWGTVTAPTWGNITGTLSNQTDLQNALDAKANLSGATFTGGIVSTLGTITTSTPMLSGTQTWNAAGTTFTGLKLNVTDTSSAAGSLLLDLQKGGTSQFKVDKAGAVTATGAFSTAAAYNAISTSSAIIGIGWNSGSSQVVFYQNNLYAQIGLTALNLGHPNFGGIANVYFGTGTASSGAANYQTLTSSASDLTLSSTWNAAGTNFTGLKLNVTNTASGASSNLLDLQVGGTSYFKVAKNGDLTILGTLGATITNQGGGIKFSSGIVSGSYVVGSYGFLCDDDAGFFSLGSGRDAKIYRDGANLLGQRNGTSAQAWRVYNTYTSATNYERLGLNWSSNVAQIYTEKGSGGGTARDLVLGTNATTAITISGTDQSVTTAGALSDSIGNVRSIPQNAQTSAYVLAATDNGKHISITTGGVTVNSGIFSAGQVVTIFNNSSSNQTITQGTSVTMYQAGTTNTGNRTLASYGVATVLCVASNTFVITGSGLS